MLDITNTKRVVCNEYDISEFSGRVEEGQLLVGVLEDNKVKAQPSAGNGSEAAMGIAYGYFTPPTWAPTTEDVTLTDDGSGNPQAVLNNVPTANTTPVVYASTYDVVNDTLKRGAIISGAKLSGNVLSGMSNVKVGDVVIVTYQYDLSAQQAASYVGDITNRLPAQDTNTIGVIKRGRVYTSNFDTSCDWTQAIVPGQVKTGPNGTFTLSGNGAVVQGVTVYELPSADSQFLGLEVNFI